jgi:hypothetical protein
MSRRRRASVLSAAAVLAIASAAPAQRVVATAPDTAVVAADTVRRLRPGSAAWRSLLVPGWGQAATGRPVTGAAFVLWEGVTFYMWRKASDERDYLREIGAGHVNAKKREVEDWLVLLVFNHLFAGAEAFVSGHLQDFPEDLKLQVSPGRIGISLALR